MTAAEYAKMNGFPVCSYVCGWNGYDVYFLKTKAMLRAEEWMKMEFKRTGNPVVPYDIGLPVLAIERDGECRIATAEERMEILAYIKLKQS